MNEIECVILSHGAVCFLKEYIIPNARLKDVLNESHKTLKDIGLHLSKDEMTKDGRTTIFAKEGALVPLITRTLLYPFSINEYVKMAQRSGIHLTMWQGEDGVHMHICGLALNEFTGKPARYSQDDIVEEVTDTIEALDFERSFIGKMMAAYPDLVELKSST